MRTAVTLNPDVAASLSKLARERRQAFEAVLDQVLRRAFSLPPKGPRGRSRFVVQPHDGKFRPGLALDKLNQLVDELDAGRAAERIRTLSLPVASVARMKAESVPAPKRPRGRRPAPGAGLPPGSKG